MKKYVNISLLLSAVMITVVCCSELQRPVDSEKGVKQDADVTSAPSLLGSSPSFSDDFEAGLDPSVWYLEMVNGAQWTHTTEGGNGYIYSPPQNPYDWNNRYTDILTVSDDFTDFVMTWDMRFHTSSWHKDHRFIYFRSNDDANPICYYFYVGVWIPTYTPHQCMCIGVIEYPYTVRALIPNTYYPWELEKWYSFKLEVQDNVFKVKVWEKGDAEPSIWSLEAVDSYYTHSIGRIGFGDYWGSITDVDNVTVSPRIQEVCFDIKPGSCPNPLNTAFLEKGQPNNILLKKGDVLPAAILGTEDFDVYDIDVPTLKLEGIAPIRSSYEDVAAPGVTIWNCECTTEGPDECMDLTLKFGKSDIIRALGPVLKGDLIQITITGKLLDGSDFEGTDCVLIVGNEPTPATE